MGESIAFGVRLTIHQALFSAHCYWSLCWRPYLTSEFMELLYVDDLVMVAETKELLLEKLEKW